MDVLPKANGEKHRPGVAEDEEIWKASSFRVVLSQVLATLAQSLLLLSLGMMVAVPTVVIGALNHAKGSLSMDNTEASWFGSIILVVQPVGAVLSGVLSETMGRKKCMMMVAVPQLAGWLLMYRAQYLQELYISGLLLGFSIGFMEAPGLSYLGEITQPSLRARMCSLCSLNVPLGFLVMYLLGSMFQWRTTALVSTLMPVIILAAISQVPESPLWLLRKGRFTEAEAALCWLRGWVTPKEVQAELAAMQAYSDKSRLVSPPQPQTCSPQKGQVYIEIPRNGNGPRLHSQAPAERTLTLCEKLKDLIRPEMMRPLRLVVLYFFFYHCGGLTGLRPYMIKVFRELDLTVIVDPYWITVLSATLQILGAILCIFTIHRLGKRFISLLSLAACAVSLLALGVYAQAATRGYHQPIVPLGLFGALFFFTNVGIAAVPWALISEVFPPRGRGVGGGMSSALYYMMYFLVSKTFLDLESMILLHGVFFLYGGLACVGLLFFYCCLPETEGHNLEDIEKFFKSKPRNTVPIN